MLINLAAPTDQAKSRGTSDTSGTGVDQLRGIENVIAGNFADSVTGNAAANRIEGMNGNDLLQGGGGADTLMGGFGSDTQRGGAGNDSLSGMAGDDALFGGAGHDSLRGGPGTDRFVLHAGTGTALSAANFSTVLDLVHGTDKIVLDDDILTAFRVGSPVTEQHFLSSPGATTATTSDQRLVYDSSAGVFYYDPDGAGDSMTARCR
jgi:Ca2+-binding RTX toxin-like protein